MCTKDTSGSNKLLQGTYRLCQVLFSWPMWAFMKAKVKLHMGFHVYTVYILLNYMAQCHFKFTIKTVLLLARQLVSELDF